MEARIDEWKPVRERPAYLGMIFFLISEVFLFGSLFWTYYYLRAETAVWPPAGVAPDTVLAGINTFFLLAGSGVMWWAVNPVPQRQRKPAGYRPGGYRAAGGHLSRHYGLGMGARGHSAPGRTPTVLFFSLLTGFHALHVFGGVVFMLILLDADAAA